MAQKKKGLTKQQRKEQRRAAMERVRQERGWEPPPPPPVYRDERLTDMLPFFPEVADPSAPLPSVDSFLPLLLASEDLVDEPELEGIIVDPLLCSRIFVDVGEEMGHNSESLDRLSEEELQNVRGEMLVETIRRLLTDELCQEILDGLDSVRLRLKEAGQVQETARVAALHQFLGMTPKGEMWAMFGLVQAIFHRSVFIGFEMVQSSFDVFDARESSGEDPVALLDRLAQSRVGKKAETLLKRVPGLSKYLANQADVTWDEGTQAVFTGELYLELYSEEELLAGLAIFRQSLGDAVKEAVAEGREEVDLPQDQGKDFVLQIDQFIVGLFTPQRLDQLRARLDAVLRTLPSGAEWFMFVYMLKHYMDEPDAVENERHFLVSAFLGELRHVGESLAAAAE